MAQVTVTIAGRSYRMACGDGEEAHLAGLAAMLDGKIEELRQSFGEIGDMRLHVMAALTIADDIADLRRRVAALEGELAAIHDFAATDDQETRQSEARAAETVARAADRIEKLAKSLLPPAHH